ncbi:MAG: hypothetical protein H0U95_09030 [Bacteroidetes bacterium]|nr:hypothetical protein [Bacteroidota bacterium]
MKTIKVLSLALALLFCCCNAQTEEKEKVNSDETNSNVPKKGFKVNKEFDKNGNLIRYDSTYSYYYSNIKNNSNMSDSIFSKFRDQFQNQYPFANKPFFDNFFFQDTLLKYDFYKRDFFSERFKRDMNNMDKLFLEMDSVKNQFFEQQFLPDKSPPSKPKSSAKK